jgi:thiol-disulfide isomerase/thioredoxin
MRLTLPILCLGVIAASCLASAASNLPSLRAQRWVNSPPLTAETLRGKVVLVDFWEYTCVNWIRTAPYIKAWNRDYAPLGLVVIGVHAPEFEFGKSAANIDRGIRDHGLTYPIAIDNDFTIWRAFGNDAWPAKYLFDNRGRLVRRWVGEGSYDEIEGEIRRLLTAAQPGIQLPAVSEQASTFSKTGPSESPRHWVVLGSDAQRRIGAKLDMLRAEFEAGEDIGAEYRLPRKRESDSLTRADEGSQE